MLKELSSRHSDLAHSLKTGLTRKTLRLYELVSSPTPQALSNSQRKILTQQARRPTKTTKSEKLLLNDPKRVKIIRKILDRQSDKTLFETAKCKINQITDHNYVTDRKSIEKLFALNLTFVMTFQLAKTH